MYNILICDDEKDIVSAIEIYLKTAGYSVYKAYNGMEAVDMVNSNDIQLVLMDVTTLHRHIPPFLNPVTGFIILY